MNHKILSICIFLGMPSLALSQTQYEYQPEMQLNRSFPAQAKPCIIGEHGLPSERWADINGNRIIISAGLVIRNKLNYIVVNSQLPKHATAACMFNSDETILERVWITGDTEHQKLLKRPRQ